MQYPSYILDILPAAAGACLMLVLRYLKLGNEVVELSVDPYTDAAPSQNPAPPALPMKCSEISAQARDPELPGALLYNEGETMTEFDGYICKVAQSPKDSIISRTARDLMIISGRNPKVKGAREISFAELGIFDAYGKTRFPVRAACPPRLRILGSQRGKIHDMLLAYGGKGGALMQYINTHGIEQI